MISLTKAHSFALECLVYRRYKVAYPCQLTFFSSLTDRYDYTVYYNSHPTPPRRHTHTETTFSLSPKQTVGGGGGLTGFYLWIIMGRMERDPERAPDTELAIAAVVDFPFFIWFFFIIFFQHLLCAIFTELELCFR